MVDKTEQLIRSFRTFSVDWRFYQSYCPDLTISSHHKTHNNVHVDTLNRKQLQETYQKKVLRVWFHLAMLAVIAFSATSVTQQNIDTLRHFPSELTGIDAAVLCGLLATIVFIIGDVSMMMSAASDLEALSIARDILKNDKSLSTISVVKLSNKKKEIS